MMGTHSSGGLEKIATHCAPARVQDRPASLRSGSVLAALGTRWRDCDEDAVTNADEHLDHQSDLDPLGFDGDSA